MIHFLLPLLFAVFFVLGTVVLAWFAVHDHEKRYHTKAAADDDDCHLFTKVESVTRHCEGNGHYRCHYCGRHVEPEDS